MKKILKYESKRKINKQRIKFFLTKGKAINVLLVFATTIYIIANSIKQIIDTINKNGLTFVFATASLVAAIFALIAQIIKFAIDWQKFFSPIAHVYEYGKQINKAYVLDKFFDKNNPALSTKAIKSGYVVEKRENSSYIYSSKVNKLLFNGEYDLKIKVQNKVVTEEEQILLASILQKYVMSKANIYNDQLFGQVTDLLVDLPSKIVLNKTCYFSNKATNDIVYSKFLSRSKQSYEFNGYKFSIDSFNHLYDLVDSNAANIIGVSTILLTKDKHIILSIQNSSSDESAGLIVATGSGSAIIKDYKKSQTFYKFLTTGMERELIEETSNSLRYQDLSFWFRLFCHSTVKKYKKQEQNLQMRLKKLFKPNSTKVYCYNRILHRGGKPDFFGITKLDATVDEAKAFVNECNHHTKMLIQNELNLLIGKDEKKITQTLAKYDAMMEKLNAGIIIEDGQNVIKTYLEFKKEVLKGTKQKYRPLEYETLGMFVIDLNKIKKWPVLSDNNVVSLQVDYMIKCLLKVVDKI